MPFLDAICRLPFAICKSNARRPKAKGYTLIELLVVIGILAVAITAILAFLTSSIKTSNQTNVNSEVKQNAEAVLAALEKQIRNADRVTDINPLHTNFMLTRQNADPLYIRYFPGAGIENGWIGTYTGQTAPAYGDYVPVSNTNLTSGINIDSCTFTVTSNPGAPQTVSVSFNVVQALNAPSRQDYLASYNVKSTISLRRYN